MSTPWVSTPIYPPLQYTPSIQVYQHYMQMWCGSMLGILGTPGRGLCCGAHTGSTSGSMICLSNWLSGELSDSNLLDDIWAIGLKLLTHDFNQV